MENSSDRITIEILRQSVAKETSTDLSKVQLDQFEVDRGSAIGDNFSSDIKLVTGRAHVDGKVREFDYIVKVKPVDKVREDLFKDVCYLSDCHDHYFCTFYICRLLSSTVNVYFTTNWRKICKILESKPGCP